MSNIKEWIIYVKCFGFRSRVFKMNDAFNIFSLAICPLILNDEVIGYLMLINEKKPRNFTKEEISLLEKIANHTVKIIKPALKMGVEENRDRIIETILKYKEKVSFGREKDPNIIVNFLRIVHLPITWLLLINQDPERGTEFYHAEVNETLQVEKVEIGTLEENSFTNFINELFILARKILLLHLFRLHCVGFVFVGLCPPITF
jgi:hypothetical protein